MAPPSQSSHKLQNGVATIKLSSSQDLPPVTALPLSAVRLKRSISAPSSPGDFAFTTLATSDSSEGIKPSSIWAQEISDVSGLLDAPVGAKEEDNDSNHTEILSFQDEDEEFEADILDETVVPVRSRSSPETVSSPRGSGAGSSEQPRRVDAGRPSRPFAHSDDKPVRLTEPRLDPLAKLAFPSSSLSSPDRQPSLPPSSQPVLNEEEISQPIPNQEPKCRPIEETEQDSQLDATNGMLRSSITSADDVASTTDTLPQREGPTQIEAERSREMLSSSPLTARPRTALVSHPSPFGSTSPGIEVVIELPARPRLPPADPASSLFARPTSQAPDPALSSAVARDEAIAKAAAMLPPSPPRRNLRARKAQQLNPYTLEAIRYQRALLRNDWEDAVISQRQWARQEKKRLRDEADRAAADSQSQWLEPDPEDEAQEESWRKEEEREQRRKEKEAKRLDDGRQRKSRAVVTPQQATAAKGTASTSGKQIETRSTASAPFARLLLSSDSETEEEPVAETSAAGAARVASASPIVIAAPTAEAEKRPGQVTYSRRGKGKEQAALAAAESIRSRSPLEGHLQSRTSAPDTASSASSSPILGPRKHRRIRSMSNIDLVSSDTEPPPPPSPRPNETPVRNSTMGKASTLTIDSSADEESEVARNGGSAKRKRRTKRHNGESGSSSDSTDYERRFRQLKKMMPAGMARKHIEDLRAMRHGKAYHSDGHISSTPDASQGEEGDLTIVGSKSTPATSPPDAGDLQPGEARKRMRRRSVAEGEQDDASSLLFPADSDSEPERSSATSHGQPSSDSDSDDDLLRLWSERPHLRPIREGDAIDRMLSRTNGEKRPRRRARGQAVRTKQSRLDAHLTERPYGVSHASKSRRAPDNAERTNLIAKTSLSTSSKKKRKKQDPRIGRLRSTHRGPAFRPSNPPVVRPRARPRLDLVNDDVLFDFQLPLLDGEAAADGAGDLDDEDDSDELMSLLGDFPGRVPAPPAALGPAMGQGAHVKAIRRTVSASSHNSARNQPSHALGDQTTPPLQYLDRNGSGSPSKRTRIDQSRATPLSKFPVGHDRHARETPGAAQVSSPAAPAGLQATASNLEDQRLEAEAWDDHEGLRVDLGIHPLPVGLSFASSTFLGRGRLYELLHLSDYLDVPEKALPTNWMRHTTRVANLELSAMASCSEMIDRLPVLFEFLAQDLQQQDPLSIIGIADAEARRVGEGPRLRLGDFEEASRFLCLHFTAQALQPEAGSQLFRLYRAVTNQIDLLFQHLRRQKAVPLETLSRLLWFRVEMCWRLLATCGQDQAALYGQEAATFQELANCSKLLMVMLLRHGLHRTMRAVKSAARPRESIGNMEASPSDETAPAPRITDFSAEIWICLIHLLDQAGRQATSAEDVSFWPIFDSALAQWQSSAGARKRPVIASESVWYCTFSLCALSHFSSSTGITLSTSNLGECWPLVARALTSVRFRFDEAVESSMSLPALNKRDQYVRVVLKRCFDLHTVWRWKLDGADHTLSKLFEVFNSHKLTDLPSESDHDFPEFLRELDEEALLRNVGRNDSCFHVFLKLVAQAGRDLRKSAIDIKDGDRKVSRLFSRISPVRVMAFTRYDVPTSCQRSMLFNHYAVVMLFLYLVPSQAAQRLRQIKSFLHFKSADYASQVACIRAMMYAAVIFRHHELDVSPITTWFGEVTGTLMKEYETLEKTTGTQRSRASAGPLAPIFEEARARQVALRRQGEVARLIVVVLRSLQHIIQNPSLAKRSAAEGRRATYPDLHLLHYSWTKDILEGQLAVDPAIGHEALKCIHTFLLQRNAALLVPRGALVGETRAAADESQDSFGDLFDDAEFDFEDPALDNLLAAHGGAETAVEPSKPTRSARELDREFAEYAIGVISPALFRLVSNIYHPDRRIEGVHVSLGVTERPLASAPSGAGSLNRRTRIDAVVKDAERRRFLETVVDCWAGCAHVLVQNGLRDWTSYLTFGNESWKRIDDPIGKRDVGLRFLLNVLLLDPSAVAQHEGEFAAMWCQAAVARVLSVQHTYTTTLCRVAGDMSVVCNGWKALLRSHTSTDTNAETSSSQRSTSSNNTDGLSLKLQDFQQLKTPLLVLTLSNIGTDAERKDAEASKRRPMLFSCLSALLSAIRLYVEDTPKDARDRDEYLDFCRQVMAAVQTRIGPTLMRGVGSEMANTVALLARQQAAVAVDLVESGA